MDNSTPTGYVYLVAAENVNKVKIGFSVNPNSRLSGLQTGSPLKLSLIQVWLARQPDEQAIHQRLSSYSSHLEWFDMAIDAAAAEIDDYFKDCHYSMPEPKPKPPEPEPDHDLEDGLRAIRELPILDDQQKSTLAGHLITLYGRTRRMSPQDNKRAKFIYDMLNKADKTACGMDAFIPNIILITRIQNAVRQIKRRRST